LTADSGYYNTTNVTHFYEQGIDGYLPDLGFRKRDPRFADVERYRARDKKDKQAYYGRKTQHYTSPDFQYDEATHTCICPAGKKLYSNGRSKDLNGYEALRFRGAKRDCLPCTHRDKCFKDPSKTPTRQVAIFIGRAKQTKPHYLDLMRKKKADIQWKLYCMVHNLLKIHRYGELACI